MLFPQSRFGNCQAAPFILSKSPASRGQSANCFPFVGLRHTCPVRCAPYQSNTYANSNGATIEASDSIINRGVSTASLPQVIFSFGTAPEYEP